MCNIIKIYQHFSSILLEGYNHQANKNSSFKVTHWYWPNFKHQEKGYLLIDKSNCKYAYHYLTTYTNYKPKYSTTDVPNCLSSLRRILNEDFTEFDIQLAAKKDIKYGIIYYNIYYWQNDRSFLSPMSMIGIKNCADDGSTIANFHYGFVHYVEKHYRKAIPYLLYAADRKNYSACHYLGLTFFTHVPNYQLARKYLSQSAVQLKDADDACKMANLSKEDEAVDWFLMASDLNPTKYGYPVAIIILEGDEDFQIRPNKIKGKAILMKYYKSFEYNHILNTGLIFYNGELINKDLEFAREVFHFAADSSQREDETATRFYISMCINGEGGPKITPEMYIKQVADSNDPKNKMYSEFYAKILINKGELYYYNALNYLDRADSNEAKELASKIRNYLEAKRRAEEAAREAEQRRNESNRGSSFSHLNQ